MTQIPDETRRKRSSVRVPTEGALSRHEEKDTVRPRDALGLEVSWTLDDSSTSKPQGVLCSKTLSRVPGSGELLKVSYCQLLDSVRCIRCSKYVK